MSSWSNECDGSSLDRVHVDRCAGLDDAGHIHPVLRSAERHLEHDEIFHSQKGQLAALAGVQIRHHHSPAEHRFMKRIEDEEEVEHHGLVSLTESDAGGR